MKKENILIIGGTSSMGLTTAQLALKKEYTVFVAGRNENKLNTTAKLLDVQTIKLDATSDEDFSKAFQTLPKLNHIIITVNAPGTASSIIETDVSTAKIAFERFWMNYRLLHIVKNYMNRIGSITLISGSSSKTPIKGYGFWGTLHGAIEALAKNAALELAPIRVNVVSPGGISLKPNNQLLEHFGTPEDVAQAIISLIENPAITNTKIDVDSGERQGDWNA
ncbi:SDR family oxidoreductase [Aquimarina sp. U1-2]|uniref:SDR family oxidoreductase n=1 Tax=Aquimarina sp. U1-2 TaxID=2823141 RepID=UPI001AECADFB|nr:SDR family oxidoreductase [Aquimarina sp. U1-2]MBP2831066.1 SDR family oxidoreductase [Aquimarina sp. U1-2]